MNINCNKDTCYRKFAAYCCPFKRDLLRNNNFVATVEICPRVVTCKKLEVCDTYYQPITIKNNGTLTRRLSFFTDPNSDVQFRVTGKPELTSGAQVTVDLFIEPIRKKFINRNRFFYILAEHPDIVWEIPILVIGDNPEIYVPELVCLHKVPACTKTFYQFVIYNPLESDLNFNITSNYETMTTTPEEGNIMSNGSGRVIIECKIAAKPMATSLLVSIKGGKSYRICVQTEPSDQVIHLSTSILMFEDTFMGSVVQKNVYICNKSMETISFQWSNTESVDDLKPSDKVDEIFIISDFLKIRNKRGCISPLSSALGIVTFAPPLDYCYNEEEDPPFPCCSTLYLFCPILGPTSYRFQVAGNILGPDIEVSVKEVDLDNIFLGQMLCQDFKFSNKGPILGEVSFKGYTDQTEMRCNLVPKMIRLKPGASGVFEMTFYRRDVGKLITMLTFKVKNGMTISILLRGTAQPAKVKFWPDVFELGNIPICIPQKRFALVTNPLPVPVVVEPKIVEDGENDPLILCVDYSKIPLKARPAAYYDLQCHRSQYSGLGNDDLKPDYSDFDIDTKQHSLRKTVSQLSYDFKENILDDLPEMAVKLLHDIQDPNHQHETEAGTKIVDTALDCLLGQSDYFHSLKIKQNYMNMDWQSLPSDAKEVAIEAERFYLNPGESKSFPIVLIPNLTGPGQKFINFQACPMGVESTDIRTAIRSKYLVNSLRLQYKCSVPVIEYNQDMKFVPNLYVDLVYPFSMTFKNIDAVPGFLYFKAIPQCSDGKMLVDESQLKFYISSEEEVEVDCTIVYRRVGTISLHGLFQLVGKILEFPFKVTAEVIPPEVSISPEKIVHRQKVLVTSFLRLFIENVCPTKAQFVVSLKRGEYQYLEPLGGILAPGQKILISIYSKFFDPSMYKNCIFLDVKHAERICIPLTYTVEGYPLIIQPDIRNGLNLGTIFREFTHLDNFVKVTNYGEKSYKLNIIRPKAKRSSGMPPPTYFEILPNIVVLSPSSEVIVNMRLDRSVPTNIVEYFTINGVDGDNVSFKYFNFSATVNIIKTKAVWSKSDICLVKEIGNDLNNRLYDTVSLTNMTPLTTSISLSITGCFTFIETGGKIYEFDLEGKASKLMTIKLDESELEGNLACEFHEGLVKCKTNNKLQKSLNLRTRVVSPSLMICPEDVTFFVQNVDAYAHVTITNCSEVKAHFLWTQKTLTLTKTVVIGKYEQICSPTVSEKILAPTFEFKLKKPTILTPILYQEPPQDKTCESTITSTTKDTSSSETTSKTQDTSSKTTNNKTSSTFTRATSNPSSLKKTESSKKSPYNSSNNPFCNPPQLRKPTFIKTKTNTKSVSVNRVLEYLGLIGESIAPHYPKPLCNTELSGIDGHMKPLEPASTADEDNDIIGIQFQQLAGCVLPQETVRAFMFLPPIIEEHTLSSEFDLEVLGGRTEVLNASVTSIKGRVQLSTTDVDLGRAAWYKTIQGKINITNHCTFAVQITLVENPDCGTVDKKLYNGYVAAGPDTQFFMQPKEERQFDWKAIYGFRYNFFEDIGIEVNNNTTPVQIHFHGSGQMPMVLTKNLERASRSSTDTIASYLTMRSVFGSVNPKHYGRGSAANSDAATQIQISSTLSEDEGTVTDSNRPPRKRARRQTPSDFVALDYSEQAGPKAVEIERLIETWKFVDELNKSQRLRYKLHRFYCNCVQYKANEFEAVINLKFTICRPLPWELSVFIVNLEKIKLNETKCYEVDLVYTGPGRAFLSVRTDFPIPGLMTWFESGNRISVKENIVTYVQTPDEKKFKKYQNVSERNSTVSYVDSQGEYRKPHAHSYDKDETGGHTRDINLLQLDDIKKYYSKIGQPPKERKNPLVLSEVCQTSDESWDNKVIKLAIMLTALGKYYEHGQTVEEYLMLDVHMGPTLPILLKADISRN